jgi:hypothetical protein
MCKVPVHATPNRNVCPVCASGPLQERDTTCIDPFQQFLCDTSVWPAIGPCHQFSATPSKSEPSARLWPLCETSIIMSQPINLGHRTFQATGSPLELQFGAIANLSQLGSRGISSSTIKINHWKDLQSMWITEAPELELRIFVNVGPVIEAIGPTFVANVEEELCNSKV